MPVASSDPRVFFAAERTLLAWLRTGLAIIAIGFLVARFGLFVQLLALQAPAHAAAPTAGRGALPLSAMLGITFVAVGALMILIAAIQHARFVATLPPADLPPAYSRGVAVGLSLVVAALGLVLAVYLAASPH
jgi:putative membrane protein